VKDLGDLNRALVNWQRSV